MLVRGGQGRPVARDPVNLLCGAGVEEGTETTASGNGCTINIGLMRPKSRGRIFLRSRDLDVPPVIDARYITDPYDAACLVEGVRIGQDIMESRALRRYIRGIHRSRSPFRTDQEREAFVRETVQTAVHPCGGCKMGIDDLAVVDPQFRVHGIEGLRVADSSAMPFLPSGNLNGPVFMMGERATDFIRDNQS